MSHWRSLIEQNAERQIWAEGHRKPIVLDGPLPPDVERGKPDPIERRALNYLRAVDRTWRVCQTEQEFLVSPGALGWKSHGYPVEHYWEFPYGNPILNAVTNVARDFLLRNALCRRRREG